MKKRWMIFAVFLVVITAEHSCAGTYRVLALKNVVKKCWGWVKDPYSGKHYRVKDMDVDHIWPKKYGGPDAEWNLVLAGASENRSKGAKIDERVLKGYMHKIKTYFERLFGSSR